MHGRATARRMTLILSLALVVACTRKEARVEDEATPSPKADAEPEPPPISIVISPSTIVTALSDGGESVGFDLRTIVDDDSSDPAEPLTAELERLRVRAGVDSESSDDPRVAIRVVDGVATGDVLRVLARVARAGVEEYVFEHADGRRLPLLIYALCACPMPESTSWCAAPKLHIDQTGVTLTAIPDLIPPPGCFKTIPSVGQDKPAFDAALDWRDRVVAGRDGGCPTATVGERGVDEPALRERLAALHRAAPGCGWASFAVDDATPWARVVESLAAVHDSFGVVRIAFGPAEPVTEYECVEALTIAELEPEQQRTPPLIHRPRCGE